MSCHVSPITLQSQLEDQLRSSPERVICLVCLGRQETPSLSPAPHRQPLLPLTGPTSRLALLYSSWVSLSISADFNIYLKCCLTEPVGTSAPRFSSNSESLGVFKSATGKSFNFVCPAQASPVPSYRLGKQSTKTSGAS